MEVPTSLYALEPGDVISIGPVEKLAEFEDWAAREIDPTMRDDQWELWLGRAMLKNLIRPPKFDGNITNICLTVMDRPYDQLFTAVARGLHFPHREGRGKPTKRLQDESIVGSFVGYVLTADLRATRFSGQLTTEIWYGKVPKNAGRGKLTSVHGGVTIQRYVAEAHADMTGYQIARDESRTIAWAVLRNAMASAITTTMRK